MIRRGSGIAELEKQRLEISRKSELTSLIASATSLYGANQQSLVQRAILPPALCSQANFPVKLDKVTLEKEDSVLRLSSKSAFSDQDGSIAATERLVRSIESQSSLATTVSRTSIADVSKILRLVDPAQTQSKPGLSLDSFFPPESRVPNPNLTRLDVSNLSSNSAAINSLDSIAAFTPSSALPAPQQYIVPRSTPSPPPPAASLDKHRVNPKVPEMLAWRLLDRFGQDWVEKVKAIIMHQESTHVKQVWALHSVYETQRRFDLETQLRSGIFPDLNTSARSIDTALTLLPPDPKMSQTTEVLTPTALPVPLGTRGTLISHLSRVSSSLRPTGSLQASDRNLSLDFSRTSSLRNSTYSEVIQADSTGPLTSATAKLGDLKRKFLEFEKPAMEEAREIKHLKSDLKEDDGCSLQLKL